MKQTSKTLLVVLAVLMIIGMMSSCKKADDNTFRVGLECAYAPFNWTQTTDENGGVPIGDGSFAGGYDVEIAKLIAEGLGKELVIVKTEWDGLPAALSSGKIDAIIAGMSPTADRKETIDFSDNYYVSDLVIVVRKDSEYANATSLADFTGAKITGQLNTFHYTVIDQIPGVNKQTATADFPTMIIALSSGKIDGYISELPGAKSAVQTNPELTYIAFDEGQGFSYSMDDAAIAVGLKKGSSLTADINKIIDGISEDQRITLMENAMKNQPASE